MSSPDVGDLSPEGPLPPLILLQQLLSAATQPSPIKAIFDRQELEVRALSNLRVFSALYEVYALSLCVCVCCVYRRLLWLCVSSWLWSRLTRRLRCLRTAARARPPRRSPCSTSVLPNRRSIRALRFLLLPLSCSSWRWASRGKISSSLSNLCQDPQAAPPMSQVPLQRLSHSPALSFL